MPSAYKIALFYVLIVLIAFDLNAIAQRFLQPSEDPIAWFKGVGAFILQALALGIGAFYLAFLSKCQSRASKSDMPMFSWRTKMVPLIGLAVMAAVSVSLLYNSVVCGSQPFPAVRGVPTCHK